MSISRSRSLLLLLLAALLAACGAPEPRVDATPSPVSASAESALHTGGNTVTVMSWNLYLGAELRPLYEATSEQELLKATTAAWQMVVTNDFRVRAVALARQIAAARPEVIGLQEAHLWRYGDAPGATTQVVYDYVQILLDALRANHQLEYRVVAELPLSDVEAPILADPPTIAYVRGTDRQVILAREGVQTAAPEAHLFPEDHLVHFELFDGSQVVVERGWVSVNVYRQGTWMRFVSTHLEPLHPYYRTLQALDLVGALSGERRPTVLAGDFNSDPLDKTVDDFFPNRLAYLTIAGAGFGDAWLALHPFQPGFTSPYPQDLTTEQIDLKDRIDFIMFRGALSPRAMAVVGTDPSDRACGVNLAEVEVCLWPSDHAGLWATFRLWDWRFLALTRRWEGTGARSVLALLHDGRGLATRSAFSRGR